MIRWQRDCYKPGWGRVFAALHGAFLNACKQITFPTRRLKQRIGAHQYYENHKHVTLLASRQRYGADSEFRNTVLSRNRIWQSSNKHKESANKKKYYQANKAKIINKVAQWVKNNPDKRKANALRHQRKLMSTARGRVDHRISVSIGLALRGAKRGRRWETLVGYTLDDLYRHIESKFSRGMSWEKLLAGEIHIDHIIPKSRFDYASPDDLEFRRCWAIENLQPKLAIENLSKGSKMEANSQIPLGV